MRKAKGIYFEDELQTALYDSEDNGQHDAREISCNDMSRADPPTGAPHEAMSALIGLGSCDKFQIKFDRELFVRCIIGLKYQSGSPSSQEERAFLNAVIGLLNGALIDVDKIDHTIHDPYVTEYKDLSLDLDRLLAGYTLYKDANLLSTTIPSLSLKRVVIKHQQMASTHIKIVNGQNISVIFFIRFKRNTTFQSLSLYRFRLSDFVLATQRSKLSQFSWNWILSLSR